MDADDIFRSFYKGQWKELSGKLEEQIRIFAESGDIVRLSRIFSFFGVLGLIYGNDFLTDTLYKQINEEYLRAGDDPRIKASYARFLAMYSSFMGKPEDASKYYIDARLFYRLTDWYQDEAVALLESIVWHYLYTEDAAEFYNVLERLEILNRSYEGYLCGDLLLLHALRKQSGSIDIGDFGLLENPIARSSSMLVKISVAFLGLKDALLTQDKSIRLYKSKVIAQFVSFKQEQDCPVNQLLEGLFELLGLMNQEDISDTDRLINMVCAKAEIFRHPWFKEQLKEIKSYVSTLKSNPNNSNGMLEERTSGGRITAKLFGKCELSCGNTVFNINSFGTRTGNELLLYLLTQNNLQVPKEVLVETFFPGEEPQKKYNRLYVNIHRVNKVLRQHFQFLDKGDFIFIRQGIVCINPDVLEEIDTYNYRKILSVANQLWVNDKDAAVDLIYRAIGMFLCDIAPGFYYLDWLDDYRQELKNMQLKALNRVLQYYREKDNPEACSEAFHCLIELDPLNEDYYIEYIGYILKDGRDVEAMNLYHQYRICLKKELGLSPSLKLKSLISRITR